MKVLICWAIWTAVFMAWNWVFPSATTENMKYSIGGGHPFHLSGITMIFGYIVIYILLWVNAVDQWVRRPVLRFGKYITSVGPGLCFVEPLFHTTLEDVPINDVVEEIEIEHVQTADNVSISLTIILTTRIKEDKIRDAVVGVDDVGSAVPERVLTTLADEAGKVDLGHLLSGREKFSTDVAKAIAERIKEWGVDVKAAEIKGFKINDPDVEKSIALKARAQKEGEAELARAEFQLRVANKLKEAAGTYDEKTWRLKGMETMLELCRSGNNNTILIPTDLPSSMMNALAMASAGKGASPSAVADKS